MDNYDVYDYHNNDDYDAEQSLPHDTLANALQVQMMMRRRIFLLLTFISISNSKEEDCDDDYHQHNFFR